MAIDPMATLGEAADAAFNAFGTRLQGAGVDVGAAYQQLLVHKASLTQAASTAADAITSTMDDEFMPADQKQYRIRLAQDVFDSVELAATKGMQDGFKALREFLTQAAQADLTPAEPGERALIRQELDLELAGVSGSILNRLFELARNPRYTAEIASGYGRLKLMANKEGEFANRLVHGIIASIPGTSQKAKAARVALDALNATKVEGHIGGLLHSARARVAAAGKPRPVSGYQADTLIPRR